MPIERHLRVAGVVLRVPVTAYCALVLAGCALLSPCREPRAKEIDEARRFTQAARAAALAAQGLEPIELAFELREYERGGRQPVDLPQSDLLAGEIYSEAQAVEPAINFAVDAEGGVWRLDERPKVRRVLLERRCSCWGSGTPPLDKQRVYRLPREFRGTKVVSYEAQLVEVDQLNRQSDGSACPAYP